MAEEKSTFQKALESQKTMAPSKESIANIYNAYKSGQMTPEEAEQFEKDIQSGAIMLPQGVEAKEAGPTMLPVEVTNAYLSGKMTDEERNQLESDIKAGHVKLAPTIESRIPTGQPGWVAPTEQPIIQRAPEETLGQKLYGAGEAALSTLTGATTGAAGQAYGGLKGIAESIISGTYGSQAGVEQAAKEAEQAAGGLTYQPKTEAGQRYAETVGKIAEPLAAVAPMAAELAPIAESARAMAPIVSAEASNAASSILKNIGKKEISKAEVPPIPKTPETIPLEAAPETITGKVKEAAKTVKQKAAQVAGISPAEEPSISAESLAQGVIRTQKAESLPEPIKLTLGSATRDASQLAFEKEQIKSSLGGPLRKRAEENNLQALTNFEKIIDSTEAKAPDISSTGNTVTKALSEGYKAAKTKTRVAYNKAQNSPEASIQVDPSEVLAELNSRPTGLKTTGLTDHAKQYAVRLGIAEIDDSGNLVPRSNVTVRQMEDFRKEINQATGFEPVEIRDSSILKGLIDKQTEPVAGPLYKEARALRAAQARKYENRAIIARLVTNRKGMEDPTVAADQVFNKSILNSSPEEITFLKRVLKTSGDDGQQAWKELQGATMRHIRDEATKGMGMDSADNPIVSPAKLHQVVTQLDKNGRLDLMLGKDRAATVRNLNDVVRYINTVPPGTLINNSGTAGVILAAMAEAGATGALTGLPVPVISALKALTSHLRDNRMKMKIEQALNEKPKF